MKRKTSLLAAITAVAATLALVSTVQSYRFWKRRRLLRIGETSKLLETALGPVEYSTWGQGPAVLVVHGSPGGYDQSLTFAKLIGSQRCSFIALSRPGYLQTPLRVGQTPEQQADLYATLLDALGIERAAVIGISGGGPSSLQFALRYPERCRGLALISTVSGRYDEVELRRALPRVRRFFNQIYSKLITLDPLLYLLLPVARMQPDHLISAELLQSVMLYRLRRVGYENDMAQFAALSPYPLEQIAVPTFVVHGTGDTEVPFEHAKRLASEIPNVKLLTINNGKHLTFYTHSHIVMPELRTFLEGLED